ncbi:class I SAM-dependent methyltransferase [Pedobacter sp. P351]|uniref:class I SAM-dependent methyltransferase n=1 Tax=Pedobacter superstes TaxID=3133441 RepID=UPI00309D44F1
MSNSSSTTLNLKTLPDTVSDGINVYDGVDFNNWFETAYNNTGEPWDYSKRAGELYRHIYSVQQIREYNDAPEVLLELGCSKGLMTELLIPSTKTIYATDISLTAIKACKQKCDPIAQESNCRIEYFVTTTPGLPFEADSFDVVTICDGLAGWWLSDDEKLAALEDTYRVLKKGGIAILTDCLMPEVNKGEEFGAYEQLIRKSPLSVVRITFLYDKLWYKLESLLKKTGMESTLRSMLTSIPLAKAFNGIGRLFGRKAARHIVVILRKD